MNPVEQALSFDCAGQTLVGVVHAPQQPQALGVVVVVGGPQTRVGSHRQFVQFARTLAHQGYAVLRFDVRGMGDSEGDLRSFEHIDADIEAAISALAQAVPAVRRVVLWGLCDAASAALMYVGRHPSDERVAGLCLLNPWVRSAQTLAHAHVKHYYLQRLREREFWAKLVTGHVAGQALRGLAHNLALAFGSRRAAATLSLGALPFQQRMARAWAGFAGPIQLLLSGRDYTAKEFVQTWEQESSWEAARGHTLTQRVDLPQADHTFSAPADQQRMEQYCLAWLHELPGHMRHDVGPAHRATHEACDASN